MHFTYRWTPPATTENLYPYENLYGATFYYGYLGVEFFFIISGFVISYTLENTNGMASFLKNRFIRLFPPMLLCSLITFSICILFDDKIIFENAHIVRNFLPSLTFTNPSLWEAVTHKHFSFISFSYWSLWVEVQFYIVSAILFFSNRKQFLRNLILATIVINLLNYIPVRVINPASYDNLPNWVNSFLTLLYYNRLHFNLNAYISWFAIGVIFHHLFKKREVRIKSLTGVGILFIFLNQLYLCAELQVRITYLIMIGLFFCMVYRIKYLNFLDNPIFRRIGVISYSIYLIHEVIGVLLINKYGGYLGKWSPISPFLAIVFVIVFAELSYRFYEKKATRMLKTILFRTRANHNNNQLSKAIPD